MTLNNTGLKSNFEKISSYNLTKYKKRKGKKLLMIPKIFDSIFNNTRKVHKQKQQTRYLKFHKLKLKT